MSFLGLLAACGGSSSTKQESPPEVPTTFDGAWAVCRNEGTTDYREIITIAATSVAVSIVEYVTTDSTCDGDGVSGTMVYASFGATTVTAFAVVLNVTAPFVGNVYTRFWVDTEASPRRLFGGRRPPRAGRVHGLAPSPRPVDQCLREAVNRSPAPNG